MRATVDLRDRHLHVADGVQQDLGLVATATDDTVDEQCRGRRHLARSQGALHVSLHARQHDTRPSIVLEAAHVEIQLRGIPPQVVLTQRVLPVEEQLMHLPERALQRRRLRRGGRGQGIWVDLGQGKVPERDPHSLPRPTPHSLELAKGPPRVRTLVIAIDRDHGSARSTEKVVHCLIDWLHLRTSEDRCASTIPPAARIRARAVTGRAPGVSELARELSAACPTHCPTSSRSSPLSTTTSYRRGCLSSNRPPLIEYAVAAYGAAAVGEAAQQ